MEASNPIHEAGHPIRRLMAQKESVFAEIAAFFIFVVGNKSTWCVGSFR